MNGDDKASLKENIMLETNQWDAMKIKANSMVDQNWYLPTETIKPKIKYQTQYQYTKCNEF